MPMMLLDSVQLSAPSWPFVLLGIVAFGVLMGWPYAYAWWAYCKRCWHAARRMKRHHKL